MFYEGQLQNGVSANDKAGRPARGARPIPGAEPVGRRASPSLAEPRRADDVLRLRRVRGVIRVGDVVLERSEAAAIERAATHFLKAGLEADQLVLLLRMKVSEPTCAIIWNVPGRCRPRLMNMCRSRLVRCLQWPREGRDYSVVCPVE